LNSSVYRLPLITTSVVAIVHGSEMSRKLGAIHTNRYAWIQRVNLTVWNSVG
jgi:hypothetical protein